MRSTPGPGERSRPPSRRSHANGRRQLTFVGGAFEPPQRRSPGRFRAARGQILDAFRERGEIRLTELARARARARDHVTHPGRLVETLVLPRREEVSKLLRRPVFNSIRMRRFQGVFLAWSAGGAPREPRGRSADGKTGGAGEPSRCNRSARSRWRLRQLSSPSACDRRCGRTCRWRPALKKPA